ncbi:MAG: hypothetical protein ACRCXK_13710 [Wohlfahrtiimonas sp.]
MKIVYLHTELHLTLDNIDYKIIRITSNDVCYLERVSDSAILTHSKNELTEYLFQGRVILHGKSQRKDKDEFNLETSLKLIPESKKNLVLKRYEYVKNADKHNLIPTKNNLNEVIQNTANSIGDVNPPSSITLYRWWKRWYDSNQDLYSLLPYPSGRAGSQKFTGNFKIIFNQTIEDVYLTRERCSKQTVVDVLSDARRENFGHPI